MDQTAKSVHFMVINMMQQPRANEASTIRIRKVFLPDNKFHCQTVRSVALFFVFSKRMRFVDASVYQLVVSYYVANDFEKMHYYDQIKSYVSYQIQSNLFV